MGSKKNKCIVCHKMVTKEELIEKYQSNFCSEQCMKEYGKLLIDAKKESNLNNCC